METSVRPLALQLPRETEDRSIGSELHFVRWAAVTTFQHCPLGAERGAEPKTGDQLDVLSRERFLHGCEVASSKAVNVPIGVHQALKERLPLGDRRSEVELRNVLVSEQTDVPKRARQRIVPHVATRHRVACVAGPADAIGETPRSLLRDRVTGCRNFGENFVVGARNLRLGRRSVAEPDAEHIRIDG